MDEKRGQILLYQPPDGTSNIEVHLQNDTVWLNLEQMAELFQRNKSTISRHIKNVFDEGELEQEVVVAKYATTTQHGAIAEKLQTHLVDYYNLDMIISVGYRVHSYRGVQFRMWATRKVSAQLAKAKADAEYDKFKERTQNELTPVEIHFIEQFEREQKKMGISNNK